MSHKLGLAGAALVRVNISAVTPSSALAAIYTFYVWGRAGATAA
jgi:hypothetical protein